jgi:hypothetical protein
MKEQHFDGHSESFSVFLLRQIKSGSLSNDRIEQLNRAFFTAK